jgi:hypothetical protein
MLHIYKLMLYFLTIVLFSACEDDQVTRSVDDIRNCHQEMNWNVETIRDGIIGEWLWAQSECVFSGLNDMRDDSLQFNFTDSLVTTSDHGTIFQFSQWSIKQNSTGSFEIVLDPNIPQLHGSLFLCTNDMMCQDFNIDGCNHYFERVE